MKILIKDATVYDPNSRHHLDKKDILVQDGTILEIGHDLSDRKALLITSGKLCVSPGWLDIGAFNGEPGFEYREDLSSLKNAAAAGGYVRLAPLPNTIPVADNYAIIRNLLSRNSEHAVEIFAMASSTSGSKGTQLSEIYDLNQADVVAFCDGYRLEQDLGQLVRTLDYIKGINGLLVSPLLKGCIHPNGQMNEGNPSTRLGMTGMPAVEEEINAFNLLRLAEYTGCRVLAHNISVGSVAKMLTKNQSPNVHVSIPYMNVIFSDNDLMDFDVNLKVWPPLRSDEDRRALIKMINSGKIEVINSNHMPLSTEEKDLEFGHALFGATGLETCFRALLTYAPEINIEQLVNCLSQGSYNALSLAPPKVEEGEKAVLTLFDPDHEEQSVEQFHSKSMNNPFLGKALKGRVVGVINGKAQFIE